LSATLCEEPKFRLVARQAWDLDQILPRASLSLNSALHDTEYYVLCCVYLYFCSICYKYLLTAASSVK